MRLRAVRSVRLLNGESENATWTDKRNHFTGRLEHLDLLDFDLGDDLFAIRTFTKVHTKAPYDNNVVFPARTIADAIGNVNIPERKRRPDPGRVVVFLHTQANPLGGWPFNVAES